MVTLAPVLIRDMGGAGVLLTPKVKKLLAQLWPEPQALGYFQDALMKRYLEGRNEIHLWYVVGALAGVGNLLSHTGNGYAREPETALLEEVGHGYSHAGLVYEQLYRWFSYA